MADHEKTTTTTVPKIWYPSQRTIRTVIQGVLSALGLVAVVQGVAPQVLDELAKVLPGSVIAWLAGAVAFIGALAGVVSRIMAIPAINALLTNIGAGSVPKAAIIADVTPEGVPVITTVQDPATTEHDPEV